jgi:hypothetical protein
MKIGNFPPTPSRFHDDAWRRDRGHDAMQAAFLEFLRDRPTAAIPEGAIVYREVEAEKPLYLRGQIVSYVDCCEILTVNLTTFVSLFEIKPRIDTVFGIVRQLKSALDIAKRSIPGDLYFCHVVVPASDPKLADLRAEWPHVWAWGITFEDGAP